MKKNFKSNLIKLIKIINNKTNKKYKILNNKINKNLIQKSQHK